jgi:hypothetical protein
VARFMILYRSSVSAADQMASASPEQAQEGMAMWMRWAEKTGQALADLGSPLVSSGLLPTGADGETGTPIGGYSIVEASSSEEVADLLDGHPHLMAPGASIEVLECMQIPGT